MVRREKREKCCGKSFLDKPCENDEETRGLCHSCYECARVQVRVKKKVTWAQLEKAGLAKPPKVKYIRKSRFDPAAYLDDLEETGEQEPDESVLRVG